MATDSLPAPRASRRLPPMPGPTAAIYTVAVTAAIVLWQAASLATIPLFLPSPAAVLSAGAELLGSGQLAEDVAVSYFRILSGWLLGCAVAIPMGLLAGRLWAVSASLEPFVNFFRFIPPIAFISLSLIWFGVGETSKVALIVYTTAFIVYLNASAGAQSVDIEKTRAAASLGASRGQVLTKVVVPATIPFIITGMRLAMGNSFMTVIAAELIAAESGVGNLISRARIFVRTDYIFVGIITLGIMGLVADLVFRTVVRRLAYRYEIRL